MSNVGQTLREAREAQNLSLYDIEDKTKIQKRYLEAIENERFDVLPGHFYTRAFIRTYADALGVDSEPLLSQIKEAAPPPIQEFKQLSRRADRANQEREPSFSLAKWFSRGLLILFLVLVIVVIYTALDGAKLGFDMAQDSPPLHEQQSQDGGSKSAGTDPDDDVSDAGVDEGDDGTEAPETEEEEPMVSVNKIEEDNHNVTYEILGAEEVTLDVQAHSQLWFKVKDQVGEGKEVWSGEIQAGDSKTYTSTKGLYIRTGNTKGAELKVNGETVNTDYGKAMNFYFQLGSPPS